MPSRYVCACAMDERTTCTLLCDDCVPLQVPVMVWSWITRARKYYLMDYIAAGVVTFGCAMFVLTGDISSPTLSGEDAAKSSMIVFTTTGLVLLSIFIVFDGLTCTVQDKLFGSFDMHSCNQLLYVSSWSALLSAGFLLASGQMKPALEFVSRHPESLQLMLLQSCVSTTVQLFISFTIKQYGALNFALMMTVRQFLSIVLSCVIFKHELTILQWYGFRLLFVFFSKLGITSIIVCAGLGHFLSSVVC